MLLSQKKACSDIEPHAKPSSNGVAQSKDWAEGLQGRGSPKEERKLPHYQTCWFATCPLPVVLHRPAADADSGQGYTPRRYARFHGFARSPEK